MRCSAASIAANARVLASRSVGPKSAVANVTRYGRTKGGSPVAGHVKDSGRGRALPGDGGARPRLRDCWGGGRRTSAITRSVADPGERADGDAKVVVGDVREDDADIRAGRERLGLARLGVGRVRDEGLAGHAVAVHEVLLRDDDVVDEEPPGDVAGDDDPDHLHEDLRGHADPHGLALLDADPRETEPLLLQAGRVPRLEEGRGLFDLLHEDRVDGRGEAVRVAAR